MKRIIEGVTYNTDTANVVARWEYENQNDQEVDAVLYQTRGGAFFIVHSWVSDGQAKLYFEATSRDEVARLVERTDNLAIIDPSILQEPPEAVAEASPSATLYIRLPTSLKDRLDTLARDDGISLNAWTTRCVERCAEMDKVGQLLGEIISTGLALRSEPEPGAFAEKDAREMVEHMTDVAERVAATLGWRGKDLEDLSNDAGHKHGHRHWAPFSNQS